MRGLVRFKLSTAIRHREEKFRDLVQGMGVGVLIQGPNSEILLSNPRALELLGLSEDQLMGRTSFDKDWDVVHEDGSPFPGPEHPVSRAIATLQPVIGVTMGVHRPARGDRVWLSVDAIPQLDPRGHLRQVVCTFIEITKRVVAEEMVQNLLREKELILKEVHHRIKNNLNSVASLLDMQANLPENAQAKMILQEAEGQVESMSILYDRLYRSGSYGSLGLADYLPALIEEVVGIFRRPVPVKIACEIGDISLGERIITPLGIILNEFITNAMKYAFPGRSEPRIALRASRQGKLVTIVFEDNGVGMPEGVDFGNSSGFGLQLVDMLVRQIGGSIRMERVQGTRYTISFEA